MLSKKTLCFCIGARKLKGDYFEKNQKVVTYSSEKPAQVLRKLENTGIFSKDCLSYRASQGMR